MITSQLISYKDLHFISIIHLHIDVYIKGEIHSKIESILKERVNFFLQNSEKMMKIGWEIRKIWHFEISIFFGKHFLTSPYEYSNERVDDVIPSQLFIYIVYEILKNFHF